MSAMPDTCHRQAVPATDTVPVTDAICDKGGMADELQVSVVIPAYNAAATLAAAINSVLVQTHPALEVLVVDDASGDGTADLARSYASHGVRLIAMPRNAGVSAARNAGIAAARGGLVAFLDADDEWLDGKLAAQVGLFSADPRIAMASCGTRAVTLHGRDFGALFDGETPQPGAEAWKRLLARNIIHTSSVIARRDALLAVGCFDEALRVSEDQDLWIKLTMHGHLGYADAILVIVRPTPGSLSSGGYRDLVEVMMPMVLGHVARRRAKLTGREVRAILGERWARVGRSAYSQGAYGDGLRILLGAMLRGDRPLFNLAFLIGSAPPVRRLKRLVRAGHS